MALHYLYFAIKKDGTPKIGATENPSVRCSSYLQWNLLETYDCPWKCGDKEIELQQQYFGKRDNSKHYAVWKQMMKTRKPADKSVYQTEEYKTKISEITKRTWENQREHMLNTRPRGSNHHSTKLTEQNVRFIRKVYYRGVNKFTPISQGKMNLRQLADKFNCGKSTISNIVNGKSWKHIK